MSIFRRDRNGRCAGVRCDFCGKLANNENGEYAKPGTDGHAAYIHGPPEWERNPDGSTKDGATDRDICEECAEDRCPGCGSESIVRQTPTMPGPFGWGGRCKDCGNTWGLPQIAEPSAEPATPGESVEEFREQLEGFDCSAGFCGGLAPKEKA